MVDKFEYKPPNFIYLRDLSDYKGKKKCEPGEYL